MSTLRKISSDELARKISDPSIPLTHKKKIEELLRANAVSADEVVLPRRMVNIVRELLAWLEELERKNGA